MIKPDYITFSQEIFDECEALRIRLFEDHSYASCDEYAERALAIGQFILSDEYGKYLDSIRQKWNYIFPKMAIQLG